MELAARTAAWSGVTDTPFEWLDGYAYDSNGNIGSRTGSSCAITPISVTPSHKITWTNAGSTANMIERNAAGRSVDYWNNGGSGTRTITLSASTVWFYMTILTTNKGIVTLYDNTSGVYLFKDGKIVNGGGIS